MTVYNWLINEYGASINPVFKDFEPYYANFLIEKGVYVNEDLSKANTFINWDKYPNYMSFWYYYVGCEIEITERLKKTEIMQYESIIMDFGHGEPVCEIPTIVFVENWLCFVMAAQFWPTVVTRDAKLILEFVKGHFLNSNFAI